MQGREVPWRQVKHHWELYLFVVPTAVLIALFMYYPAASGIFHSFFRWNGADVSEYRGLSNYIELLKSTDFWNSFRVVFIIGACNVAKMIPAILVAVCIHRCSSARLRYLYRVLFVVPMIIPPLVTVLIWRSLFFEATSGYMNGFLEVTHLFDVLVWLDSTFDWGGVFAEGRSPAWLGHPSLLLPAVIILGFPWVGSFAILMHLAKLGSINPAVYDAADIDGVNWWSKFRHVELPLVAGSIYITLVFVIIGTIKDAGTILLLTGIEGGPGGVLMVPALLMMRKAFVEVRMGSACAVGVVLMLVVMGLQKLANLWVERDEIDSEHKRAHRTVFLLAAILLVAFRFLNPGAASFHPIAMMLLYLAWPCRTVIVGACLLTLGMYWDTGAWRLAAILILLCALPHATMARYVFGASFDRFIERLEHWRSAGTRRGMGTNLARRRAADRTLRFSKHAAIWSILAIAFIPVYLMIVVSLKENPQFYSAPVTIAQPLHAENWAVAWDTIRDSVGNTIYTAVIATALTLFFALAGAYFFARLRVPLSGFLWNALLILMMYPAIASLIPLYRLLGTMGLLNTLTAIVVVWVATGQAASIFVLTTFVADVPRDLFEAAEIDGAGHFRQMWSVVRPLSGPILGTVGIMVFVGFWNDFILPLVVLRDNEKLTIMVQLMRMSGEYIKYWGPMMAGYALASVPVIVLFVLSMRLFVRGISEGALKS